MQNYENLIKERLKGTTPREKFEYLKSIQILVHRIAYPKRGSLEESWTIQDAANIAFDLTDQHVDYEKDNID